MEASRNGTKGVEGQNITPNILPLTKPTTISKRTKNHHMRGGMQLKNVVPKCLLLKRNIAAAGRQTICQPSSLLTVAKGWGPVSATKSWAFLLGSSPTGFWLAPKYCPWAMKPSHRFWLAEGGKTSVTKMRMAPLSQLWLWRLRYLSVQWHFRRHSRNCFDHLEFVHFLLPGLFSCRCLGFLLSTLFVLLCLGLESAKFLQLFFTGTGRRRRWARTGASSVGSDSMRGTTAMIWASGRIIFMLVESPLLAATIAHDDPATHGSLHSSYSTMMCVREGIDAPSWSACPPALWNHPNGHQNHQPFAWAQHGVKRSTRQSQIFDTQAYQCIWAHQGVVDVSIQQEGGPNTKLGMPGARKAQLHSCVATGQIFQEKGFSERASQQPKEWRKHLLRLGVNTKFSAICHTVQPRNMFPRSFNFKVHTMYMHLRAYCKQEQQYIIEERSKTSSMYLKCSTSSFHCVPVQQTPQF